MNCLVGWPAGRILGFIDTNEIYFLYLCTLAGGLFEENLIGDVCIFSSMGRTAAIK